MAKDLLKITAHLTSPIAGDVTLPIDGVLLYQAMVEKHGAPNFQSPREAPEYDPAIVPLEKLTWSDGWLFNASWAIWDTKPVKQGQFITRRYDTALAEVYSNPDVDTGRGEFRNIFAQFESANAPFVAWYVSGDAERIYELLKNVFSIGKHRHKGYGAVSRWELDDATQNPIIDSDGYPLRAIPVGYAREQKLALNINARIARIASRPPYWDMAGYQDCYIPRR